MNFTKKDILLYSLLILTLVMLLMDYQAMMHASEVCSKVVIIGNQSYIIPGVR